MLATRTLFQRALSVVPEKNVFIKNFKLPVCSQCVYYKRQETKDHPFKTSDYDKCMKFGEQNVVTGEIIYKYADYVRKQDLECGMKGKHFVPKKK